MNPTRPLPLTMFEEQPGADAPAGDDDPEANAFVLPENLAAFDADGAPVADAIADERLAELETEALAAFDLIRAGRLDADALQALSDLTEAVEAVRAEAATRMGAAQGAQDAADALAQRIAVPDSPAGIEDAPPADADATPPEGGDGGAEAGAPSAEAAPADAGTDAPPDAGAGDAPAPEAAPEPAGVAAAAPPAPRRRVVVPLGGIAAHAPTPNVGSGTPGVSMVAAAELPGITPGTEFASTHEVAVAMHARTRLLGNGHRAAIATISRPTPHRITEQMSVDQMQAVIAAAIDPNGAAAGLVAAGGWCAPNQVLYDLFAMESTDGLYALPTVGIDRGGIDFPDASSVPTLRDVFGTDALWVWTEQNDIDAHTEGGDDPTKPCARIPCVEFTSERLAMNGICLTHGNLANAAYPELTRRFIDLVMAAHEHVMSVRRLARVIADSSSTTMDTAYGVAAPVLSATELQVAAIRDKYRMNMGVLMEAVYPSWTRMAIRAELSKRTGVDLLSVTDQQIDAWFAQRGVRPQFVYNWQSLETSSDDDDTDVVVGDGGGENGEPTKLPDTIDFLVYPAGTWIEGTGGSINLNVTRDSTLNATNDYSAAFTEEATLIAQRGPESRRITVGNLDYAGLTGEANVSGATY